MQAAAWQQTHARSIDVQTSNNPAATVKLETTSIDACHADFVTQMH